MKDHLQQLITTALEKCHRAHPLLKDINIPIQIERTRDKSHGDFACNVAMMLAKPAQMKPRDLAKLIQENMPNSDFIKSITIAGPGFINFHVTNGVFQNCVKDILAKGQNYGKLNFGANEKINIEYVSANPTGPLHVGHGRGAAFGATLSNVLSATGFACSSEYYVNDAGRQMNILATSVWLRYLESCGQNIVFPKNGYKGDYIKPIADELKTEYNDKLVRLIQEVYADVPEDETDNGQGDKEAHIDGLIKNAKQLLNADYKIIFEKTLDTILTDIREDLSAFNVNFDTWFSEKSLADSGAIKHAIETLDKNGHLYQHEGATWFNASKFNDDKDRVLIRENGQTTYFASDIAYLLNKFDRGFAKIICIFGADHHGYIARLNAAATALGLDPKNVKILLVQFANLYRGKEKVRMSTRSGEFVTLRQLREEVGKDAARFFYVTHKAQQHMDFDLELAKSQSSDNPIYYIQYAYARICSVLRQMAEKKLSFNQAQGLENLNLLSTEHEKALLVDLSRYEEIIELAANSFEPHNIANYLRELANDVHTYYNAHQFITDDAKLRDARIALISAAKQVIHNALKILGVSAPEKM